MDFLSLFSALSEQTADMPEADVVRLSAIFSLRNTKAGQLICLQGEPDSHEYFLFEGRARSKLTDAEGREVSLNFYLAPMVITPNIARTNEGASLVDIEILEDGIMAQCDSEALLALMIEHANIREWANGIMRKELVQKIKREWCLSALDASGRLNWFRENYSEYELVFSHTHIASHLGMTPVTLSRIRNAKQ